jgi:hypothetical protein
MVYTLSYQIYKYEHGLSAAEQRAADVRAGSARAVPLPEVGAGKIQYMMLVCTDPAVDPREFAQAEPVEPWIAHMNGRGIRQYGSELDPPGSARTVRVRDRRAIVTDGPFAETKEQIAGFDVLECADLDEAIEAASAHPMARLGMLEVRPFWPFEED